MQMQIECCRNLFSIDFHFSGIRTFAVKSNFNFRDFLSPSNIIKKAGENPALVMEGNEMLMTEETTATRDSKKRTYILVSFFGGRNVLLSLSLPSYHVLS